VERMGRCWLEVPLAYEVRKVWGGDGAGTTPGPGPGHRCRWWCGVGRPGGGWVCRWGRPSVTHVSAWAVIYLEVLVLDDFFVDFFLFFFTSPLFFSSCNRSIGYTAYGCVAFLARQCVRLFSTMELELDRLLKCTGASSANGAGGGARRNVIEAVLKREAMEHDELIREQRLLLSRREPMASIRELVALKKALVAERQRVEEGHAIWAATIKLGSLFKLRRRPTPTEMVLMMGRIGRQRTLLGRAVKWLDGEHAKLRLEAEVIHGVAARQWQESIGQLRRSLSRHAERGGQLVGHRGKSAGASGTQSPSRHFFSEMHRCQNELLGIEKRKKGMEQLMHDHFSLRPEDGHNQGTGVDKSPDGAAQQTSSEAGPGAAKMAFLLERKRVRELSEQVSKTRAQLDALSRRSTGGKGDGDVSSSSPEIGGEIGGGALQPSLQPSEQAKAIVPKSNAAGAPSAAALPSHSAGPTIHGCPSSSSLKAGTVGKLGSTEHVRVAPSSPPKPPEGFGPTTQWMDEMAAVARGNAERASVEAAAQAQITALTHPAASARLAATTSSCASGRVVEQDPRHDLEVVENSVAALAGESALVNPGNVATVMAPLLGSIGQSLERISLSAARLSAHQSRDVHTRARPTASKRPTSVHQFLIRSKANGTTGRYKGRPPSHRPSPNYRQDSTRMLARGRSQPVHGDAKAALWQNPLMHAIGMAPTQHSMLDPNAARGPTVFSATQPTAAAELGAFTCKLGQTADSLPGNRVLPRVSSAPPTRRASTMCSRPQLGMAHRPGSAQNLNATRRRPSSKAVLSLGELWAAQPSIENKSGSQVKGQSVSWSRDSDTNFEALERTALREAERHLLNTKGRALG
jgi:hypothetical protein